MDHPYPLGTIVRKRNSDKDDGHKDGAFGVISPPPPAVPKHMTKDGQWYWAIDIGNGMGLQHFYFVLYDDIPVPVGTIGHKLEAVNAAEA